VKPTTVQGLTCAAVAIAAWFGAWLRARDLLGDIEFGQAIFVLAGLAVLAGTTVRFGGGLLPSALLMTMGSLFAGNGLPVEEQLRWFSVQATLIAISVGAQALAQDVRRGDNTTAAGSLFAIRAATTALAIAGGIVVTTLMINLIINRSLGGIVIPVGLATAAFGLWGLQRSLKRTGDAEIVNWVPPPPSGSPSPGALPATPPPPPMRRR